MSSMDDGALTTPLLLPPAGQTPLMYACYANCPEMVKLLLAQVRQGNERWGSEVLRLQR